MAPGLRCCADYPADYLAAGTTRPIDPSNGNMSDEFEVESTLAFDEVWLGTPEGSTIVYLENHLS